MYTWSETLSFRSIWLITELSSLSSWIGINQQNVYVPNCMPNTYTTASGLLCTISRLSRLTYCKVLKCLHLFIFSFYVSMYVCVYVCMYIVQGRVAGRNNNSHLLTHLPYLLTYTVLTILTLHFTIWDETYPRRCQHWEMCPVLVQYTSQRRASVMLHHTGWSSHRQQFTGTASSWPPQTGCVYLPLALKC